MLEWIALGIGGVVAYVGVAGLVYRRRAVPPSADHYDQCPSCQYRAQYALYALIGPCSDRQAELNAYDNARLSAAFWPAWLAWRCIAITARSVYLPLRAVFRLTAGQL